MKLENFGRRLFWGLTSLSVGAALLATPADAAAPVPADGGARIIATERVGPRTVDITVDTPSIAAMDPKVRILLPEGWSQNATRTWPVLYVLPGGPDTYTIWTEKTDIEKTSEGSDVIVVMPEAGQSQGFVDWYNGGKGGSPKWETFHTRDVRQLIERNYRGGTDRAVMGISSGGSGAMMYATRNPGLYKYAAAFSAVLHPTKPGLPAIMLLADMTIGTVTNPFAKLGDPLFDRWNWLEHDPYVNAAALRGTGVYISAGTTGLPGPLDPEPGQVLEDKDGDVLEVIKQYAAGSAGEKLVGLTSKDMAARLDAMDIPATVHLYGDGLHAWPYWNREYKAAWPLIMKALGV
ncbi:alpha/beta hydrolase family protein [Actinocorallia sp. A-T 12471]|uniref:alpha/beta hydrolase n=1 Tax=Actinocorallia sp. A-T 12471 TaxID=3089813 RepID=UPI0029CED76F|nr:alpha/beta hydrolase family protein [Actinocorallia sp. A-T 12471]MDX6742539.1 alpha/beta hydrolase family protein [Actinocorallia sp. A-T 12471]